MEYEHRWSLRGGRGNLLCGSWLLPTPSPFSSRPLCYIEIPPFAVANTARALACSVQPENNIVTACGTKDGEDGRLDYRSVASECANELVMSGEPARLRWTSGATNQLEWARFVHPGTRIEISADSCKSKSLLRDISCATRPAEQSTASDDCLRHPRNTVRSPAAGNHTSRRCRRRACHPPFRRAGR